MPPTSAVSKDVLEEGPTKRTRRQSTAEKTAAAQERAAAAEREKEEKKKKKEQQQQQEVESKETPAKRPGSSEGVESAAKRGRGRPPSAGKKADQEAQQGAENKHGTDKPKKKLEGGTKDASKGGGKTGMQAGTKDIATQKADQDEHKTEAFDTKGEGEKEVGGGKDFVKSSPGRPFSAETEASSTSEQGENKTADRSKIAQEAAWGAGLKRAAELEKKLVESHQDLSANTLEKGHIYFFYRPRVQQDKAQSPSDVARMYIILKPVASRPTGVAVDRALEASETKKNGSRLIIVSKKKLPDPGSHERFWGFVKKVSKDVKQLDDYLQEEHYDTKTRGTRDVPAGRPLGAGMYSIVVYHNSAHLSYVLQAPEKPTDVQESFNIEKEGSFVLSVRNPDTPSAPQARLESNAKASFPKHLKDIFGGRRFISADPVEFLDHDGCEVLLIGAHKDVGPMGKCADELFSLGEAEEKKIKSVGKESAVFSELRADSKNFRPDPLFGMWA